jgi:hypothetical protein
MSDCEGCEPASSSLQKPPIVVMRKDQAPSMDPAAAPKVSQEVMVLRSQYMALKYDVAVLMNLLLTPRPLFTEADVLEAKKIVSVATRQAFEQLRGQLGRGFAQAPTTLPPTNGGDPRRAPR